MFLFLDPGGSTGYALYDGKGNIKGSDFGDVTGLDSFVDLLTMKHRETPLRKIFYEPYLMDNRKIFLDDKGNKRKTMLSHNEKKGHQDTLEIIGSIKTFGKLYKIPCEEIRYVQLTAALAQAGLKMPANHSESHKFVALAYGHAYFVKEGILKVRRRPIE